MLALESGEWKVEGQENWWVGITLFEGKKTKTITCLEIKEDPLCRAGERGSEKEGVRKRKRERASGQASKQASKQRN